MSSVDPLNPMMNPGLMTGDIGGGLSPVPPPSTSPGQPVPRPGTQPQAGQPQQPPSDPLELLADPKKLAEEYEANKRKQAELESLMQQARSREGQKSSAFDTALDEPAPVIPEPGQFNMPQPQDDMQVFAKSAPLLAVFAALGGKLTKQSGLTMLKAQNAMMAGGMAGNQQAYQQAMKVYEDEYQKFMDREKQKAQIWRDQMAVRRDTLQDREAAWRIAHQATGDILAQEKEIDSRQHSILQSAMVLAKQKKDDKNAAKERDRITALNRYDAAMANYAKLADAKSAIDDAYKLLPAVLAKYNKQMAEDRQRGVVPKPISQWMVSTGDFDVQQFVGMYKAAKPMLAALETAGTGARSNMLLQQMISDSVPANVYSMGIAEIDQLARRNMATIDVAWKIQQNKAEAWKAELKRMGVDLPDEPTYDVPASALPSRPASPAPASAEGWGAAKVIG